MVVLGVLVGGDGSWHRFGAVNAVNADVACVEVEVACDDVLVLLMTVFGRGTDGWMGGSTGSMDSARTQMLCALI